MKHFDDEEAFHARDRKEFRKQRRHAQKMDRSKFKKTDLDAKGTQQTITHDLRRGRVIAISGEGAQIDFEGTLITCPLKGLLKKEFARTKNLIAVGDWVRCTEDNVIKQVEERTSILSRTDISGMKEQLIAVNIDQVIISVSIINPPLKPALVDRYLIAAAKGKMHPIIVINKTDLLTSGSEIESTLYRDFLAAYEPLGFPILSLSVKTGAGLEALRSLLQNKTSVFSGQSGVGKSSLLNACFSLQLKVGDLAVKTSKGSHTTTAAKLLPLPGGGYCVDTPGIRSFGIWNLTKDDIIAHFHDLTLLRAHCKYPDCCHMNEPECAVQQALETGCIPSLRYESYLTLLEEVTNKSKNQTWS